jgi:uncharacterized protein
VNAAAESLINSVVSWSKTRDDILGFAVVGSYARGDARPDSDVDLVIVCSDPSKYLDDTAWVANFGAAQQTCLEDWGLVQSLRVLYRHGLEVEFGVTSSEWTKLPPDGGTAAVVREGFSILLDRTGQLGRLLDFVRAGG